MARTKKPVRADNFYTVYNWMPVGLKLSGNSLLVYAFIYAYSTNENGKGCYFGGHEAISQATGCTTNTVERIIGDLNIAGLVDIKQAMLENGLKRNYYRVSINPLLDLEQYSEKLKEDVEVIRTFSEIWDHGRAGLSSKISSISEVKKEKKPKYKNLF